EGKVIKQSGRDVLSDFLSKVPPNIPVRIIVNKMDRVVDDPYKNPVEREAPATPEERQKIQEDCAKVINELPKLPAGFDVNRDVIYYSAKESNASGSVTEDPIFKSLGAPLFGETLATGSTSLVSKVPAPPFTPFVSSYLISQREWDSAFKVFGKV